MQVYFHISEKNLYLYFNSEKTKAQNYANL